MKIVGINIKKLRLREGITLREMAKGLGVSASFISQIESGKASPSLNTLKSISTFLSTTIGELIGEGQEIKDSPVTKTDERMHMGSKSKGIGIYLLTSRDPNKQMEPLLFKLKKALKQIIAQPQ